MSKQFKAVWRVKWTEHKLYAKQSLLKISSFLIPISLCAISPRKEQWNFYCAWLQKSASESRQSIGATPSKLVFSQAPWPCPSSEISTIFFVRSLVFASLKEEKSAGNRQRIKHSATVQSLVRKWNHQVFGRGYRRRRRRTIQIS